MNASNQIPSTICNQVKQVRPWTPAEKHSLRLIIEHALRVWPALARTYSQCQTMLVIRANEHGGYDWDEVARFDLELIKMCDAGELDAAVERMAERLKNGMDELYPDCPLLDYKKFLTEYSERRRSQLTLAAHQD